MIPVATRNGVPQFTLAHYEEDYADRHLLHGIVAKWARERPHDLAIINADTRQEITWERFDRTTSALAARLLEMGFRKGDYVATSLPFLSEHIFLAYACFKIGVIHAPLDLRLKAPEVLRCLGLIKARGFAFLGRTPLADFGPLGQAVRDNCPFVEHLLQFAPPGETIEGAVSALALAAEAQAAPEPDAAALAAATASVREEDGAQVTFTTGSTGYPKPALLAHRSITCQNMCLGGWLGLDEHTRMLVNLPPSHVGGQAEQLMTPFFWGGTVVLLHVFDPTKTLQAIQDHRVTVCGQIPALYNLEWRLPEYERYDLSSLDFALYGGQQVPRQFLDRLAAMAPRFGTGLGLTESAGFCTYSTLEGTIDDILASIGYDMPVYPMSIRAPRQAGGAAGAELADGEVGHICFQGPQTFLGYVNDPQATAQALSSDGVLYTGDIGSRDEQGLHFAGRARWIIKPKGYQVFPAQVEDHFCELRGKVAACGVVGVEHGVFVEAVVAFVEPRPGVDLAADELEAHAEGIASYMRPLHYVLLEPGGLPLNRVAKTDYVTLQAMAIEEITRLRAAGGWDR